ncbi:uncharacterized protein LOC129791120 [Lutzomyia longipalpis]|uniref:uncharacterized protein LOC129791120 n=1 Tax=Lutzomyia longipalpis TaxID=7200 RepID=UPI0024839041|nr:uncharacterized protein LOC129791120 [Lutzomyia longipalpis]
MESFSVIFLTVLSASIALTNGQNSGSCLICDSSDNPICATLKDEAALISSCGAEEDYCFVQMDEFGHIQRGCGSASYCQGVDSCTVCQGANCNNGPYPAGRRQCHKCSGVECENPLTGPVEICNVFREDDSCYTVVVIDEGSDIYTHRGCVSDEMDNQCESYPDICVTCNTNGCNNQPPRNQSELSCIKCTEPDPACRYEYDEESGQMCGYEVYLGRPERCYTHIDIDGGVRRGCLDDFRTDQQILNDCNGDNDFCTICTTNNCNWEQVAQPSQCVVCSSAIDSNCALLGTVPSLEECPTGSHDKRGCFLMYTNNVVSRGCVGSLDSNSLDICKAGEDCKICLEDGCNRKVNFQTCYTCNSNEDQECIMSQSNEDAVTCSSYTDNCITYIEPESKRTVRGCQGETSLPPGVICPSDTCSECSGASCNSLVFPTARRSCNRCYSTNECENDLTVNTAFQSVCEFYEPDDQCFSVLVEDIIHRGCLSDASPGVQHCQEAGEKCLICDGQYCNSVAAYRDASIECIKCSNEDPACEWAYTPSAATTCEGTVGLGVEESCYVIVDDNGTIIRGCTLEDPSMCQESELRIRFKFISFPKNIFFFQEEDIDCEICTGDGCNNKGITRQLCIQCRSDVEDGEHCAEHPEGINATLCEETDITYEKRGCYIQQLADGAIRRGCATELSADQLNECKAESEEKLCHYCDGPGCNDQPGGSTAVTISYLIVLTSLLIVVLSPLH